MFHFVQNPNELFSKLESQKYGDDNIHQFEDINFWNSISSPKSSRLFLVELVFSFMFSFWFILIFFSLLFFFIFYLFAQSRGNRHTLTIRNVTYNDLGNYTCQASNNLGKDRASLTLSGIPSVCTFDSVSGVLNCILCITLW